MRSLPKFLGLAVAAGILTLGWTHQARAAQLRRSELLQRHRLRGQGRQRLRRVGLQLG